MKQTINFKGKDIVIDLTPEQIASANRLSIHYTDIKTLEDALSYLGETVESFNNRTASDDDVQKAYKELEVICQAVRQENELGDKWYYPWFNSTRSSRGFSYDVYYYGYSSSYVGSRLCVENSEKAKYIGEQFIEIYNRYMNGAPIKSKAFTNPIAEVKAFTSYTDIKTFDDACLSLGIEAVKFTQENANLPDDVFAYLQLRIISKALNGGSHMDYTDEDVYKYYPWFNAVGSSRGFSSYDYGCAYAASGVGSRLTYKSSEIAEYAGKQFTDIYNKYIN